MSGLRRLVESDFPLPPALGLLGIHMGLDGAPHSGKGDLLRGVH